MNDEFIKIFNLYKNDVYRLAYSYTKNKSDTDDIAQNVFIKLYKHKDILKIANDDIKKWLFKVTINECKSLFLSHWRIKVSLFDDKDIKVSDSNNDLLDVIANLNKKERIIVFLHYYEGYKIKEIAEMMKLSEVNVKVLKVNTMNVNGKQKRMGRYVGKTSDWKKAIVTIDTNLEQKTYLAKGGKQTKISKKYKDSIDEFMGA